MDNMSGNMGCDNRKDNEIINAWKKILSTGDAPIGEHWSVGGVVTTRLAKDTYDTLTRQKAEIENLKKFCDDFSETLSNNIKKADLEKWEAVDKAKSEAIKEFAERFNSMLAEFDNYDTLHIYEIKDRLDILKEMVGDDDA